MKITRESDYAVRIVSYLAKQEKIIGAKQIAEDTDITQRFALKILRKLCMADILQSFKGNLGGYKLKRLPENINMKEVIEAIEGEIAINDCLENNYECSGSNACNCVMRQAFATANAALVKELSSKTFDKL
ncbi:MAG: Rrf2 family transcriptional regulator [Clostridia bacterium]